MPQQGAALKLRTLKPKVPTLGTKLPSVVPGSWRAEKIAGRGRFYDLRIWRDRLRPQKLRRDPLCEAHLKRGHAVAATEVDHDDGDTANNAPENLVSMCHNCHSEKTVRRDGALGIKPGSVRERGCKADGTPTDPNHYWNRRKE